MTTVLHATDSAGLVSLVPSLAGFTPRDSVVLLPFRGSRTPGAMRVDLPGEDAPPDGFVRVAVGLVSRVPETDAVAILVYTDEPVTRTPDGVVLPRRALVTAFLDMATELGLRIVYALCVTPEGWADYLDGAPGLRPSSDIPAAPEVIGRADVSGDQHAGTGLPPIDLAERERVARALRDIDTVLDRELLGPGTAAKAPENPQAVAAALMLDDLPHFFESFLDTPEAVPPFATAALLWCLGKPPLRDTALLQWATDLPSGREALTAQLRPDGERASFPKRFGDVFLGQGPRPDPDRLRLALSAVRRAASCAPRASRTAPLTLAAWLSWALGRSSHAEHYLRAADDIDPDYRLAELLRRLIDVVALPDWVFDGSPE